MIAIRNFSDRLRSPRRLYDRLRSWSWSSTALLLRCSSISRTTLQKLLCSCDKTCIWQICMCDRYFATVCRYHWLTMELYETVFQSTVIGSPAYLLNLNAVCLCRYLRHQMNMFLPYWIICTMSLYRVSMAVSTYVFTVQTLCFLSSFTVIESLCPLFSVLV